MPTSSPSAQILTKIDQLTEQVAALSTRVDALSVRQSLWQRLTQERHIPPPVDSASLPSVLRYHERGMRRGMTVYYSLIGVLYLTAMLSLLMGQANYPPLPPLLHIPIVIFYALVGLGNLSCILIPTLHNQLRMVVPTVAAALIVILLRLPVAVAEHQVGGFIPTLVFWLPLMAGHIAWGRTIRERVDHGIFTRQLREASEKQVQS